MTSKFAVVKAYTDLIGVGGDIEAATAYFSDDFQNFDKDGTVAMTKEGIIGMAQMMNASFEDYGFVLSNLREEDGFFIMTGHIEGARRT